MCVFTLCVIMLNSKLIGKNRLQFDYIELYSAMLTHYVFIIIVYICASVELHDILQLSLFIEHLYMVAWDSTRYQHNPRGLQQAYSQVCVCLSSAFNTNQAHHI